MKLKKIFVKNFKGIHQRQIVDFDNCDLAILDGPNGYGKTTIFDVIELCLRGKIERTVSFNHVTKKNQGHLKPFYQHTKGEDVVLKVWFHDGQQDHIIIKHLDKSHDGKEGNSRPFRPDGWSILQTYYTQDPALFEPDLDTSAVNEITQQQINEVFYGNNNQLHIDNLYPLFNYLQQEENIYFLKKDEEAKKNELNFLFQTQKEADDLEKIDTFLSNIRNITTEIDQRIRELGEVAQIGAVVNYEKLFVDRDMAFDKADPFEATDSASIPSAYTLIAESFESIALFLNTFDPLEYKKEKGKQSLAALYENRALITAYILQNFTSTDEFEQLKQLQAKRKKYTLFLSRQDKEAIDDGIFEELQISEDVIAAYKDLISQKAALEKELGEIDRIIVDLIDARQKTLTKFQDLNARQPQDSNCPLCNAEWDTIQALTESVESKTEQLINFNREKLEAIERLKQQLNDLFITPFEGLANTFLTDETNHLTDSAFEKVRASVDLIERVTRLNLFLSDEGHDLSKLIITERSAMENLDQVISDMQAAVNNILNGITVDQDKLPNKQFYKELFNEDEGAFSSFSRERLNNKREYISQKYNLSKISALTLLSTRLDKLKKLEQLTTGSIRHKLNEAIKEYKLKMVERIKVPFYIYSGKILQNYQQGLGIFIDMQESTNRVRFLADKSSDHDIIHHLSSGQLAVVSIAFCLSMNKVYRTNGHFKFLAIDDPVQTMDDMNVHSFIELMRHEFKDYQIILSTHEDNIAKYMRYKFSKFGFVVKPYRVQDLFYN
jgi:exonuclease SbcC